MKLWCFSNNNKNNNSFRKSQLALHIMNKDDIIIIHGRKNNFIDSMLIKYNISPNNVFCTRGTENNINIEIFLFHIKEISDLIKNKDNIIIIPSKIDKHFLKWYNIIYNTLNININYEGDSFEWISTYGFKDIIHPSIEDNDISIWDTLFPNSKIQVPQGYVCNNIYEMYKAWDKLDRKPVVIKPIYKKFNNNNIFINNETDMDLFEYKEKVLVQENLNNYNKKVEFISTKYCRNEIILGPIFKHSHRIIVNKYYRLQSTWGKKLHEYSKEINNKLLPTSYGTYDFALVDNKTIYIIDIETGIFNGNTVPKSFLIKNNIYQHDDANNGYITFTYTFDKNISWNIISKFIYNNEFVLNFDKGNKALFMVYNKDYNKCNKLKTNLINKLDRISYYLQFLRVLFFDFY